MMALIVFVTAYDHYAVNAFDLHAVDYVLKPVEDDRLEQAVQRARALRRGAMRRTTRRGCWGWSGP